MTREEIKQEAEEQVNVCTPYHTGSFIQGYIAAVESWQAKHEDQKEINKELVDENEALKVAARMSEKTEKQLRAEIEEFKETNHELAELAIVRNKRIAELEKENAELKKKIGIYQIGMYDEIEKRDRKLTKAKELIEDMYDQIPASHSDYYKDVMERARQFLWEKEK